MAYDRPSFSWPLAHSILPKPGSEVLRFAVDPRPVNKLTIEYQFPMLNVAQEMTEASNYNVYAELDFI